jgi:eukaryotic-like serine/threonine-protein kinase
MTSTPPGTSATKLTILCPHCRKPNERRLDRLLQAKFCQHCGRDVVLNNDGPRYYITRVIKEGGQGAVYEAVDESLKIYAVKEMLDRFFDPKEREEAITRFETEAKMLQGFRHPRVPRIYADFKDDERHYLVMDFVRGEDLEDIVKRDGMISEAQTLVWADQICDVLELLHHQDPPIIFRDMKPSNIMIERDGGGVKLIDFGIAKVFHQTNLRGTQIGTPGYAPPEQYQGIAGVESDVYALGATLHHLLTGRDPRDFPMEQFRFPPVRSLNPAVSERTSAAIARATQPRMEDRFHAIADLRAALVPAAAPARPRQKTQPIPANVPSMPLPPPARPPAQPPVAVARPNAAAQPQAAQQTSAMPTAQPQPGPQAQQPTKPKRSWRWPIAGIMFTLIAIALIAATVITLPGISVDLPRISESTATAQTLSQRTFTANDMEVIVPTGGDVRQVFSEEFLRRAREQFGAGTIVNPNAPPGFIGSPEELGAVEGGTRYRASMQGFILVPSP